MKHLTIILFISLLLACKSEEGPIVSFGTDTNILLIIADDMGKDAANGYLEGSIKPNTPNLDRLRQDGLSFTNFWVTPTCSPTRSSIITGKYGYRTGVKWANDALSLDEKTLHQYINEETDNKYSTGLIGKWHLSGDNPTVNPETYGIDYYAGLLRGGVQDYYQWQLYQDGSGSLNTNYITEVFTDLSINWINEQTKPWFLWLAYNAPHTPFHVPPSNMHSQGDLPEYTAGMEPTPYYMAAIEAMDFQIGRLLENIPQEQLDNTLIIFLADNGTPPQVAQAPFTNNTAKGSIFQGGINVPMFVSGKYVSRTGEINDLITGTDIFSTIAAFAGSGSTEIHDSKSFMPLITDNTPDRNFQYSEMYNGDDDLWAISDGTYKLIVNANGDEMLYDLSNDPYESENLLLESLTTAAANAKTALEDALLEIRN